VGALHFNSQTPALSSARKPGVVSHGWQLGREWNDGPPGGGTCDIWISLSHNATSSSCPNNHCIPLTLSVLELNATSWATGIILLLGQYHPMGTDPMAKFMIKSMFTPSLTVNPQSQTENNSPWRIPGSPIHTQQASIVQLLGMINASHQALNHSNPPLVSDCWICRKPGPIQYLGVILNQSTVSPPTSAPGTSDYPFLAPVPLYGNSSSPITGQSGLCA